jgi:hypothetical protein
MPAETSVNTPDQLPASLRVYLNSRIYFDRLLIAGRLLGTGVAIAIAWILSAALLDRLFGFSAGVRIGLIGADLVFVLFLFLLLFWRMAAPFDLHQVAATMEPKFDQRLETLVSQWIKSPASQTTQPQAIIAELWRSVEPDLKAHPVHASVPWKQLLFPWLAALCVTGVVAVLWFIPSIGLPQLSVRLLHPGSPITPVTTTHLTVSPGDANVVEQSPLTIRVVAERLGQSPPVIHFSSDSVAFAKAVMSPGESAFIWSAPPMQKDLIYYITGGDARTPFYHITLLHPPAVSELHVHYDYPAYTHHDSLTVTTRAGPIEAPQGTHVGIDVVSLTPLSQATLQIGGQNFASTSAQSPNIRHLDFVLDHDVTARLHLIGANDVPGTEDTLLVLSAIEDQPPLLQLVQPAADIHLTPRDLLTIAWQALDDFGVQKILLQWQINNDPPHQVPLPTSGDSRRCVGAVDVDLANMPLKIGDMLSLSLLADDGDGHETHTPLRRILISPRSVDVDTYLRLGALRQGSELIATLLNSLRACTAMWADKNRLNQNLASASDAAALLRQTILQAIQHTADSQTVIALSQIGDCVARIATAIEQAQIESQIPERLIQAATISQQIQVELGLITQGEQAAIVLADRANVREMSRTTQIDPQLRLRVEQTLARAAAEAANGAHDLGISAIDPQVDAKLSALSRAEEQIVTAMKPVDLQAATVDWMKQMNDAAYASRELAGQLEMAADIESVRINGEPVWARDLQLAGRAAHRIEETALHDTIVSRTVLAKIIADFPSAFDSLLQAHQHRGSEAAAARAQMKLWAAEPDLLSSATDVLDQPIAQDLAMEANARMAQHDYAGAAALDQRLADTPEAQQGKQNIIAAARQMRTAERVDQINAEQQALAAQTNETGHPSALARDQERVAQNIDQVRRQSADAQLAAPNSRDLAMAALLHAQQALAGMPAHLVTTKDCVAQIQVASDLSNDLDRFNPDTSTAVAAIRNNLIPALLHLHKAIDLGLADEIVVASTSARANLGQVESSLTRAQQHFADQDPLMAAQWAAHAAATALLSQPPDLTAAHRQQNNFAQALQNAWNTMIRQAALDRLAGSETIPQPLSTTAQPSWQTTHGSSTTGNSNSEPAGYTEALRVYFQKLSEEREGQ